MIALWILAKARGGENSNANENMGAHRSVTKPSRNNKYSTHSAVSKKGQVKEPVAQLPSSLWTRWFPKDALQKTAILLKQCFPEYQVARKKQHLLISKQGIKVAMITVDKKIAVGQRRLGDIPVINYHRAPSRAELLATLKQA